LQERLERPGREGRVASTALAGDRDPLPSIALQCQPLSVVVFTLKANIARCT
jgi:hypothetical protein